MKFKNYLLIASAFVATAAITISCDDDDPVNTVQGDQDSDSDSTGSDGGTTDPFAYADVVTWPADTVVNLSEHFTVPSGKTLIIREGAQIIASTDGVGANHAPVEFTVNGNLYCQGTEEKPILFSIPEEDRTDANIFQVLWGGIVATEDCEEILIDHTIIEYTGGQVIEGSPAASAGIYTAGDDAYPQITTNNINGRYVITNSILRNGWSDGIYLMGGNAIIANNVFSANGYDGAEAVNVKAGCTVDIAGNVMYSPNTNGMKLSSSGQSENRGQAKVQAYNNTIINAGWRRDGEKGGCVYVEKNALANVYNNLIVNCKFRAMTPNYDIPDNPDEGYDDSSFIDYNFYASGTQRSEAVFDGDGESGVAYAWQGYNYDHEDYNTGVVDAHSIIATENNLCDPLFVNYDINGISLTNYIYDDDWDFHVQSGSPVLSGAYNGSDSALAPYFEASGLSVNGETYTSPGVENRFGAFGTN